MIEFLRANIRAMAGYTPGEQPADGAYIKLNTNENPYPPSPRVFEAIRAALSGDRLRKYPDQTGRDFRRVAGNLHKVDPDCILIGNGSDDILTMVTRAFVPEGGLVVSLSPGYVLYQSLAEIQGASFRAIPYTSEWTLPYPWPIAKADLTFIASPNSPSGTQVAFDSLERLVDCLAGPLILDEAYVDFSHQNGLHLVGGGKVFITRSLSKSYALAGIRFGYGIGDPSLTRELTKVKDSYNCDVLSLAAATAALEDQGYMQSCRTKVLATRERLSRSLAQLGFAVTPSQANFVWCRRSDHPVRPIYEELKRRFILVRYMSYEGYGDGLRISVGSDGDVDRLLKELTTIV